MREMYTTLAGRLRIMAAILCVLWIVPANGGTEHSFPVLTIGTQSYKNVTVTTKAKDYIFILHSAGMNNIKVADLSEELRAELGYAIPVSNEKKVAAWTAATVQKIDKAQVAAIETKLNAALGPGRQLPKLASIEPWMIYAVLGGLFLCHLFFSYCSMLICRKTGKQPGVLVWIPVFQMIPLFKAAGMSGAWFLALFVPVLNLVAHVIWSFKIVQARSKGPAISVMLLLPLTNILAYLYLAFSDGDSPAQDSDRKAPSRGPELMTLETA
jgi:hypothetical protein